MSAWLRHGQKYSAQRLDLFAWCVWLNRLLVGFRTHFKSLHFHSFHSFNTVISVGNVNRELPADIVDWVSSVNISMYAVHSCICFYSLEGFQVVRLSDVISTADIIVTCTGKLRRISLDISLQSYISYLRFSRWSSRQQVLTADFVDHGACGDWIPWRLTASLWAWCSALGPVQYTLAVAQWFHLDANDETQHV